MNTYFIDNKHNRWLYLIAAAACPNSWHRVDKRRARK